MATNFSTEILNAGYRTSLPVSYSPSSQNGPKKSVFSDCFYFRRGHGLVAYGNYTSQGGDGGKSPFSLKLIPEGLSLNSQFSGRRQIVGHGSFSSQSGIYPCTAFLLEKGDVYLQPSVTSKPFLGSTLSNGDIFYWLVEIPIEGWT